MKNTLTLIRNKIGHGNIEKFIEEKIGIPYRTFVHQTKNGNVKYKTIKLLIMLLDIKFEDFKDYEFIDNHDQQNKEEKKSVRKEKKIRSAIEELEIQRPQKLSSIFK